MNLVLNKLDNLNIMNKSLKESLGINRYIFLMRKPMMIFGTPTQEDEFSANKEMLDNTQKT